MVKRFSGHVRLQDSVSLHDMPNVACHCPASMTPARSRSRTQPRANSVRYLVDQALLVDGPEVALNVHIHHPATSVV